MNFCIKLFFIVGITICAVANAMQKEEWVESEVKELLHRPNLPMLTRALAQKFRRRPLAQGYDLRAEVDFRRQKFLHIK